MSGKICLILFLFIPLFFPFHQINANPTPAIREGRIILENNDAGEEISIPVHDHEEEDSDKPNPSRSISFYDFKKSFQEVSTYLTPTLEQNYDVFVMVNTFEKPGNPKDYIPSQFMRVLRKSRPDQKVFIRNTKDVIVKIHQGVLGGENNGAFEGLPGLIPISSGAGHLPPDEKGRHFVDTPTGIYRINKDKSIERRFQENIYHGLYFDLVYPSGWVSGLAIHGTEEENFPFLGNRQSSLGCVRTTQNLAYILYEALMSEEFMVENLPDMDRKKRLKSELRDEQGHIVYRPGPSALFIIFYGYENQPDFVI